MSFVSSESTNITNDVSIAYGVSTSSSNNSQKEGSSSYTNELKYSCVCLNNQVSHLIMKILKQSARSKGNQESRKRDAGNTGYKAKDNGRRPGKQEEPKALVTLDGDGVDWTGHAEDEQENFALMAHNNSGSNTEHVKTPRETVKEQNTYSPSPKADKRGWNGLMSKKDGYGTFNAARQNPSSQAAETSTARKVNTARPIPVTTENKANKTAGPKEANHNAGTQDNINAGNSEIEAEPAQEYFDCHLCLQDTSTVKSSEAKNGDEKPNEDTEKEANDATEVFRKEFAQCTKDLLLQAGAIRATSTNTVNTVSTPISTASPSNNHWNVIPYSPHQGYTSFILQLNYTLGDPTSAEFQTNLTTRRISSSEDERKGKIGQNCFIKLYVKSAFFYGMIGMRERYVSQPLGFVDPKFPKKVYKIVKVLYGLHQAPRASYATLSTLLLKSGYRGGTIDKTLFIKKEKNDIMLVQMNYMGELNLLSLDYKSNRKEDVFSISQDKYVAEILKKFDFASVKIASTLIETQKSLTKDEEAADVDVHHYRSVIGSLMYLTTSSQIFILQSLACSRFQEKSTTRGLSSFKQRLISCSVNEAVQLVATSTTEAEYVATANYYGQVLWIQNQMLDYGFNFINTKIYIDNESTICIVKNPVFHSKTKHIKLGHQLHYGAYEKNLIQGLKIHTDAIG
ncbi:putative ribonuclease H-like domain-containing protein [Tanacetum coccineum]